MEIHISNGAKGGVGKSQWAQCLINNFSKKDGIIVFETDTQVPDVARGVQNTKRDIELQFADLRSEEGWLKLLEALQYLYKDQKHTNKHVIISLPGADMDISQYIDMIGDLKEVMQFKLWEWFLLNSQKDSVVLLKESLESGFGAIADRKVAVRNGFFGKEESFTIFNNSETSKLVEIAYLPNLAASTAKELRNSSMTIDETVAQAMEAGEWVYSSNLKRWAIKVDQEIDRIMNIGDAKKEKTKATKGVDA